MYNNYEYPNYLYHHGIKGMKWGVRRFQKKDGTLTSEGKKRYVQEVSDNSQEQADSKRKLTRKQKVIIAGVTATVTVLTAYGAYKLSNSRQFDRTIKAGKDFYRQGHANESIEGLNELVYASFKKSDAKKYAGILDGSVGYKLRNSKNVKVAGTRSAEKIYKDLVKNNEYFASHYGHMSYKDFNGSLGFANDMLIEQNKLFNKTLKDTYMSPFFDALRSKGYDAIVDTQDAFAKVPVILINSSKDYRIVK